jgi:hypothetical protein
VVHPNSSQPLHIAADCLREVLLECGIPEEKADLAKIAFICLKQSLDEDVRDRLIKIASQLLSPSNHEVESEPNLMQEVKMNVKSDRRSSSPPQNC